MKIQAVSILLLLSQTAFAQGTDIAGPNEIKVSCKVKMVDGKDTNLSPAETNLPIERGDDSFRSLAEFVRLFKNGRVYNFHNKDEKVESKVELLSPVLDESTFRFSLRHHTSQYGRPSNKAEYFSDVVFPISDLSNPEHQTRLWSHLIKTREGVAISKFYCFFE